MFLNQIFLRARIHRIHKEARIVFHHIERGGRVQRHPDGDNDNSRATTLSGTAVGRVAKGDGTALSCSLFIVSALLPLGSLSRLSTTPTPTAGRDPTSRAFSLPSHLAPA